MDAPPERTALYRLYDATDRLLYIGITDDVAQRFTSHASLQPWWPKVARKDVTNLQVGRREALRVEAAAIRSEFPLHNGKHNAREAPFSPADWPVVQAPPRGKARALAELIRMEVTSGRWARGARVPKARDIGAASGVSEGTADLAYRYLKAEGVLQFRHGRGIFVA